MIGYDFQGFAENYWHHYVQSGAGIMAMLEPLLRLRPVSGDLLDVGCGFGFVPHFWQSSGLGKSVGLETSEYGRIGREKLGADIRHSYYAPIRSDLDGRFRYVFASEVLEHVPDPASFVAEISAGLAPDGILVLTTPDAKAIRSGQDHSVLLAALSPGFHYFLASELALSHLLRQAGFRYVRVESTGTRLFAWASHRPLPDLAPVGEGWETYLAYLNRLSNHPDHHVAGGARYRLFKDRLNTGDLAGASLGWKSLCDLAQAGYGIDLADAGAGVDHVPTDGAVKIRKLPEFSATPSWLGCALYFGAKYLRARGTALQELVLMLCRSMEEMGRDVEDLAQFAQEPAYFIPQARELLARCLACTGGADETALSAAADAIIGRAEDYIHAGQHHTAETLLWQGLYQAVADGSGRSAEAAFWSALARLVQSTGDLATTEICLEAAVARAPRNPSLQARLGLFAFMQRRYRRAYSAFRLASHAEPDVSVHWANLAACSLALTCYRLARSQAQTALTLYPANTGARTTWAQAELALGRPEFALEVLVPLQARATGPDKGARLIKAVATLANGAIDLGLFALAELAEAEPDDPLLRREFQFAIRRHAQDAGLLSLFDGLGLHTWDAPPRAAAFADIAGLNGPETVDVVVLADPGLTTLRDCLVSLAAFGTEWIQRVTLVGSGQTLALADLGDLPFDVHVAADLDGALLSGEAREVLLLCGEATLLPDTLPALVQCLIERPAVALVAAWPLSGPMSAHPSGPEQQEEEPLPAAAMAAALGDRVRGAAVVSVPVVPAGCVLVRKGDLASLMPLSAGPPAEIMTDLCLRLSDQGRRAAVVLNAPLSVRKPLQTPDWSRLYDRHSALRVLSGIGLFDILAPIMQLRRGLAEDMALLLPQLPSERPDPVIVRPVAETLARMRWLTKEVGELRPAEELCLFVAFAPEGTLPPLTRRYISALRASGLRVVLCVNVMDPDAPADPALALQADHVVLRRNEGYDFAAWADVLREQPSVWKAGLLLFANDSLVGPVGGLGELVERIRQAPADFVAMTDSRMHRRHVLLIFTQN